MTISAPVFTPSQRAQAWLAVDPASRLLLAQDSDALACVDFDPAAGARPVGMANRRAWWLLGPGALSGCSAGATRVD